MIGDKYRVERELGRGGFGVVLGAIHLALDQRVAIKVLTSEGAGEGEWREDAARFRREGRATAALRSEHVVRILDVDVLPSGNPYLVMEYLEGQTLHHVLHTREPLPVGEAVDHVLQILDALAEAHAAGIVHRDLKPANVFLTLGAGGAPVVKVLDFGVSKTTGAGSNAETIAAGPLTRTGAVIGTVAYMAPEQMLDAKRVDGRADLWSVAILLFELLTRQTPFGPQNGAALVGIRLAKPPRPITQLRPDVPLELEAILTRCLEKAPENRYATAKALAKALARFATPRARPALDRLRAAAPPTGAAAAANKAPPSHRGASAIAPPQESRAAVIVTIVALSVSVLMLGLALGMWLARR